MDLDEISMRCRVCLNPNTKNVLLFKNCIASILDKSDFSEPLTIADKITYTFGQKVLSLETLPYKICNNCLLLLNNAYKFRKLLQQSEDILKNLLSKSNNNDAIIISLNNRKTYKIPKDVKYEIVKVKPKSDEEIKEKSEIYSIKIFNISTSKDLVQENGMEQQEDDLTGIKNDNVDDLTGIKNDNVDDDEEEPENSWWTNFKSSDKINTENFEKLKFPILCEYCGKRFMKNCQLVLHVKRHFGTKDIPCEVCGKLFYSIDLKNKHCKIHSGVKPYKCHTCSRRFTSKSSLHVHSRLHSGERPYKCRVCEKTFVSSSSYSIHKKIHEVLELHHCKPCNKIFRLKKHFKSHLSTISHRSLVDENWRDHSRLHSGEKPYKCKVCEKKFAFSSSLSKHKKIHEILGRHHCKSCNKTFRFKKHFKSHLCTTSHQSLVDKTNISE